MRITVLGSAAAEGVPAIWCECPTCQKARENGGKDIRRRCSYWIDEDTLVDLGPDFFWQTQTFGIDERKLQRLIITHQHEDHLSPVEFLWRHSGFSVVSRKISFFGGFRVLTRLIGDAASFGVSYDFAALKLNPVLLEHGKYTEDGDLGILPLNAAHDTGKQPFVYLISRGGRKVFICNDTGILPQESLDACAGQQADLIFLDCTMGFGVPDCEFGHMGVESVVRLRDLLLKNGALKPNAEVYVNHFSHNGRTLQADLEAYFAPKNIKVAYDGLVVNL